MAGLAGVDIEPGRIAAHFLHLGALMLFALHVLVLHRLLAPAHPAAALLGTAVAEFGFVTMAASSMLHVSTAPLAALYTADTAPPSDLRAIEYAWAAAHSVFDTMLTTGVLLVPIGIVGAVIAVVDPVSMFAAASVLAITVFHLSIGWRTLTLARHAPTPRSAS